MLRMKSDIVTLCLAGVNGELEDMVAEFDPRAAIGVVLAAGGYPADYSKGHVISGIPEASEGLKVFHAGTADKNGQVVTSGGRVLCATALGNSVTEAQQKAYELTKKITWDGMFHRNDIAYRAIARENNQ